MSNTLDDRLKNEYSTQYTLVIGEDSFYPQAPSLSLQQREEKISESAVVGYGYELPPLAGSSPPTKVDPFRQAAGKLWSYKGSGADFYDLVAAQSNETSGGKTAFYIPFNYATLGGAINIPVYEDVSDQWAEFFDTNVYADSINLKRKATRIKVRYTSDDLLQNRLTMLSLITDINKKNQPVAYANLSQPTIDALQEEYDTLVKPELITDSFESQIDSLENKIAGTGMSNMGANIGIPNLNYNLNKVKGLPALWSGSDLQAKLNDYQALYDNGIVGVNAFVTSPDADIEIKYGKGDIWGPISTELIEAAYDLSNSTYKKLLFSTLTPQGVPTVETFYAPDELIAQNADVAAPAKLLVREYGQELKQDLITSIEAYNPNFIDSYLEKPQVVKDGVIFNIANAVEGLISLYVTEIQQSEDNYTLDAYPIKRNIELLRFEGSQPVAKNKLDYDVAVDFPEDLGNSFKINDFLVWLKQTKIQPLEWAIEIEKLKGDIAQAIEDYDTAIDQLEEAQQALKDEMDKIKGLGLSFDSNNYNYDAVIQKDNLSVNTDEYTKLGDIPTDDPNSEYFTNQWEDFSLNGVGQAILNGQLNSFYNPTTNTYSYDTRTLYRDTSFGMQLPMSPKAMSLVNTPDKNEIFVDVKPTYNYYSKFYEEGTKQTSAISPTGEEVEFTERQMPLIYEVPLDEDPDGTPSGDTELNSKFQFEKFGHKLLNCGYNKDDEGDKRNLNIILDQNSKQFLDKYNNIKTQFPFYVDFNFKSDVNKDFATLFNSTGMSKELIKTWISNFFFDSQYAPEPDKQDPITSVGQQVVASGYYDPLDPDPLYNGSTNNFKAGVCRDEIYKINTTKDFYKIVPPQESSDAQEIGDKLVRETEPDYNTREFDLNRWLDGYIKAIAGQQGKSAGNIPYSSWIQQIIGDETLNSAAIYSKTFYDSGEFFTSSDELEKALKAVIFLGKYRQLVDMKARNYSDIMNKDLAYSETLFYRVEKVAVDESGSPLADALVQSFWLIKPNDKENEANTDIMRYIDTQVKYDQNYEYTVYAYQLVVGTRYGFQFENQTGQAEATPKFLAYAQSVNESATNEGFVGGGFEQLYNNKDTNVFNVFFPSANNQSDDRLAVFDVVCEPDVKLIEMPFYKKRVAISDAPPMAPEVDIVPLRGQDNDIRINFYPGSVGIEAEPIAINPQEDNGKFLKNRLSQDRTLLIQSKADKQDKANENFIYPPSWYVEPKLKFQSDDFATHYEIYRTEEPPSSYIDFKDSTLITLDAAQSSSYTDKIEQNKKYYYVFRTIDVHGNISNPSPIYQVEMVENSGAVYPVISIYNFEQQKIGSKTKPFKRHLKIDAAAMQGVLDAEGSNLSEADSALAAENSAIFLGNKNTKLFSSADSQNHKKFKFRIKSRHTGKIIDLNVSFKARKIKPREIISCGDAIAANQGVSSLEEHVEATTASGMSVLEIPEFP